MAKKKVKAAAAPAPQSKDEAARAIAAIGVLQREFERLRADMNDAIARITAAAQPELERVSTEIMQLGQGVQIWCEANRDELTQGGKVKSANLVTGDVVWRNDPPSVTVRNAEVVLQTLRNMNLGRFIRTLEEVNKEAILAARSTLAAATADAIAADAELIKLQGDYETLGGISGVKVNAGVEKFSIVPVEIEAD